MSTTYERTRLICLFHHSEQAQAALRDLHQAGISPSSISVVSADSSATGDTLDELDIPERDLKHLLDGLHGGGTIVSVAAAVEQEAERVEHIFADHRASKIDELEAVPEAGLLDSGETVIPIVQEDLAVGKRDVDRGGVRVYRRVIEIPVEDTVALREEHVVVERHAVDRAVTDADLALSGDRTIELVETAEEAIVGKRARVVEEVVVGKVESERTEHIHETLRHTEVDVEEVVPTTDPVIVPRQTY